MGNEPESAWKKTWLPVMEFAAAVLTIIGVILGLVQPWSKDGHGSSPEVASPSESSPHHHSSTKAVSRHRSQPEARTEYLSNMSVTAIDEDSETGNYEMGTYSVDGTTYGHSVLVYPGCDGEDGGDFWAEFNLKRDWSTLTATVGPSDDDTSGSRIAYSVYGDGERLTSGSLPLGSSRKIHVSVKGTLRLKLFINYPVEPGKTCLQVDQDQEAFVWGNARLSTA